MWKAILRTAIPVAAFIVIAVIIWGEAKRCEAARDECITEALPSPPGILGADYAKDDVSPRNKKQDSCYLSQCYLCRVLTPASLPNVYLVILGGFGIIAAVWTLIAIQSQTNVSINSERAWVLVETAAIRSSNRPQVSLVYPTIRNKGKTFGKVIRIRSSMKIMQTTETLPRDPTYENDQTFNFLLYPNGKFEPIAHAINDENLRTISWGGLKLWVYGEIVYVDFSGRQQVARYCLAYMKSLEAIRPVVATDILLKYVDST